MKTALCRICTSSMTDCCQTRVMHTLRGRVVVLSLLSYCHKAQSKNVLASPSSYDSMGPRAQRRSCASTGARSTSSTSRSRSTAYHGSLSRTERRTTVDNLAKVRGPAFKIRRANIHERGTEPARSCRTRRLENCEYIL